MDEHAPDDPVVVLVIDMLAGFCTRGNLCSPRYAPVVERLSAYLEQAERDGARLVFLADTHTPDDPEFRMFPPHCVEGSGEEEVVPELSRFAARGTLVRKHSYSGFFGTSLADVLERLAPRTVVVTGVCTDICVLHTVAGLRVRGYDVVVREDLVETYDAPGHDAGEYNRFALTHMRDVLGATVE